MSCDDFECDLVMFSNSRGSSGRERNDKPASSTLSQPGSFSLGSGGSGSGSIGGAGGKEPSEDLSPEEPRREVPDTPKLQGGAQHKAKSERSRSRDSGEDRCPGLYVIQSGLEG